MVKIRAQLNDGNPLLAFGLSAMNIAKLKDGQPIHIDLAELGLVGKVFIFYGETEELMRAEMEMAELIGPNTTVIDRLSP